MRPVSNRPGFAWGGMRESALQRPQLLSAMLLLPQMTPGGLIETAAFDTADGLYDCAWSEENENLLLAACGDGSVKVYDLAAPPMANPLRVYREHKHEVRSTTAGVVCSATAGGKH